MELLKHIGKTLMWAYVLFALVGVAALIAFGFYLLVVGAMATFGSLAGWLTGLTLFVIVVAICDFYMDPIHH